MEPFIEEIEATIGSGIYSTALLCAIMIPDAAGAIEYRKKQNGFRYSEWYNTYVGAYASNQFTFDGDVVWKLRNGMVHETAIALLQYGFDRVAFTTPDAPGRSHMCTCDVRIEGIGWQSVLNIDLVTFCNDLIAGARKWLGEIANDPVKRARLDRLIQYRPMGLDYLMSGVPMVT